MRGALTMARKRAVRIVAAVALVAVTLSAARPAAAAGELTVTAEVLRGGTATTEVRRDEAVTIRVTVTNTTAATATITGITLPTSTGLTGTPGAPTPALGTIAPGGVQAYTITGLRGSMSSADTGVSVVAAVTGTVPDDTLSPADAGGELDQVSGTSGAATASLVVFSVGTQLLSGTAPAAAFITGDPVTVRLTLTSDLDDPVSIGAGGISVATTNLGPAVGTNAAAVQIPANSSVSVEIGGFTAGPSSPATAQATVNGTVPDNTFGNDAGGADDPVSATGALVSAPVGTLTVATTLLRGDTPATAFFAGEAVKVRVTVTSNLSAAFTIAAGGVTLPTRNNLAGTASTSAATTIAAGAQTTTFDITGLTAGPGTPIEVVANVIGTLPDDTLVIDSPDTTPDTVSRSSTQVSATVVAPTLTFTGNPVPPGPVERGSTIVVTSTFINPAAAPSIAAGTLKVTAPAGTTITSATIASAVGAGAPGAAVPAVIAGNEASFLITTVLPDQRWILTVSSSVNTNAVPVAAGDDFVYTTSFASAALPVAPTAAPLAYELTQADLQMIVDAPAGPEQLDPETVDIAVAYSVDNVNGDPAVGVAFNAPAPPNAVVTGLPVTENGWTCVAATLPATGVDCTLAGALTAAATPPVVNITWTVGVTGTTTFVATVTATTFDPATAVNNTGSDSIIITEPEAPVMLTAAPVPDVTVASDVSATVEIDYTITNGGPKNVKANITFATPPGGTLTSVSGATGCSPALPTAVATTCSIGTIPKASGSPTPTPGLVTIKATYSNVPQSAFVDPNPADLDPGIATFSASITPDKSTFQAGSDTTESVPVEGKAPRVDIGLAPVPEDDVVNVEFGRVTPVAVERTFTFQNFSPFSILPENNPAIEITLPDTFSIDTTPAGCTIAALVVTCPLGVTVPAATAGSPRTVEKKVTFSVTGKNSAGMITFQPVAMTAKAVMTDTVNRVLTDNTTTDTDDFAIDVNRRPKANAEVGPSVPAGGVLRFTPTTNGALHEDTDNDTLELKIAGSSCAPETAECVVDGGSVTGLTYAVTNQNQMTVTFAADGVISPDTPGGTVTVTINYLVSDGPAPKEPVPSSLKVRLLPSVKFEGDRAVPGSFGTPLDTPPRSFGVDVTAEQMGPTATILELLEGDLGENAEDVAFPAGRNYDIFSVAATHPETRNVEPPTGDTPVEPADSLSILGKKAVRYVAPRAYTSDEPSNDQVVPPTAAPPDDFKYTTRGQAGVSQIYTVEIPVTVHIKNQNPIGIDSPFDVPNGVTQTIEPAVNDIDGNTLATPITTRTGGEFLFDDEGDDPLGDDKDRRLKIVCLGPHPATAAELATFLATADPRAVCPTDENTPVREGWVRQGTALDLQTPDSRGKVTVTLAATGAGAFRAVTATADATVVGNLDFMYVVVDNYGGAGFAKATAVVPNTPPQVIEGVRTVLKNTPTVVVDTRLAAQDLNNDDIVVSGTSARTEHGTTKIGDNNRTITYTPDRDYLGPDKLLYNVSDGRADGAASAVLQLNVIEQPGSITDAGGGAAGAGSPAGNLAATGGDPLALTLAAGLSLGLGLALAHAGRRRQSLPLLERARHLRT